MELFKWHVLCTEDCKNVGAPLELFFVTDTNEKPEITCGPCDNKAISNIQFVESYVVSD